VAKYRIPKQVLTQAYTNNSTAKADDRAAIRRVRQLCADISVLGSGYRLLWRLFGIDDRSGPQTPYLSIKGTARVEERGAPELLDEIATAVFGPGTGFPPPDSPPGYLTRITIEKVGGVGPWTT
jgi:hypothetical protein